MRNSFFSRFFTAFGLSWLVAGGAVGRELTQKETAFFESHIRPALIKHCYECHSEEKGKRKGGLWLDRKAGWVVGGDSGTAIVPRDLKASLLIETIRYADPELEMPPKTKLPADVIAKFEQWVAMGAPDPRTEKTIEKHGAEIDIEEGRRFWSFKPLDSSGVTSIDESIASVLAEKQLDQAPRVSPEARLRRAKTDLTGFPTTIAEQDEFLANPSDEKFAEMVDRWLASDSFGERWGRHWLDLARYSDTSGGGRTMPFPNAWRFRDYVVKAFNEDRGLDHLITAHLAGDLLPVETPEERIQNLVATGFLVMGPNNYENQNKALLEMEIVDEQIDTMGRAFLGMTIGCARCHDHKFDPIPTKDYYSLAGIFLSTNFVTHSNVSQWHKEPIPPTKKMRAEIASYEREVEVIDKNISSLKSLLAGLGRGAGGNEKSVPKANLRGIVMDSSDAEVVGEWMASAHSPRFVGENYIHDQNTGRGQKKVIYRTRIPKAGSYEVRMSYSASGNRNPAVPVTVKTATEEKVFVVNQKLRPSDDRLFHQLWIFDLKAGEEVSITISNDTEEDGVVIADAVQWLPLFDKKDEKEPNKLTKTKEIKEREKEVKQLESALAEAEKEKKDHLKKKPVIPQAMSVVDRAKNHIFDSPIRIRGVEDNLGEIAPRGFLQVAMFDGAEMPSPDGSGRLELAKWVTDPKNPLTARVLANRIWYHLTGQGIVSSVDNFGVTGQLPSHPKLLDYLAKQLIESGWSTKALVREIVLSDTYAIDSEFENPPGELIDPENALFWKGHRRALDVEVMRDSILKLSGVLDPTREGPSLPEGFRSEYGYQFKTLRRSVYLPVFRNAGFEMFNTFDFANPNFGMGSRSESTIATQALFMTNNPMVHRHAAEAASELLQDEVEDDAARVRIAFRKTLGREPSVAESDLALTFLRSKGDTSESDDADAWAALQRSLFACVDFRFLR